MSKSQRTTPSIPAQPPIQSDRTWTPKKTFTPRSEWRFMREYSLVWQSPASSNFGPFDGGVQL